MGLGLVLPLDWEERVEGEVWLAPVNSAADDTKELSVEVLFDRYALVRREYSDLVNFARLHQDRLFVRIQIGLITDVAVDGCVEMLCIPEGTAAGEVAVVARAARLRAATAATARAAGLTQHAQVC